MLYVELNKVFEDGSLTKSCKIISVFSTINRAPMSLAEYDFNHYTGLVDVPISLSQLVEILDLDNDLRPYLQILKLHQTSIE